jgi:hypothetical protein
VREKHEKLDTPSGMGVGWGDSTHLGTRSYTRITRPAQATSEVYWLGQDAVSLSIVKRERELHLIPDMEVGR